MAKPALQRSNNRNAALLDKAAELFATQGFRETTMRDIAAPVGMLPGSIYYHYPSKDALLLAVYEAGVDRIVEQVEAAIAGEGDPFERFRVAMATHIGAITRDDHYTRVINRVLPEHVPKRSQALTHIRDRYEQLFREVIDALPLDPSVDKGLLRLMMLGAVNYAQFWFNPKGGMAAERIGHEFARYLLDSIAGQRGAGSS